MDVTVVKQLQLPKDALKNFGPVENHVGNCCLADSINVQPHVIKANALLVTKRVFNCVYVKKTKNYAIAVNLSGNVKKNVKKN